MTGHLHSPLTELLGIEHPIIQAPMAGGPSTVDLASSVSEVGGLGSIAAAMLSPDALRAEIRGVRARTSRPFAVNLFVPLEPVEPEPGAVEEVQSFLAPYRERVGVESGEPRPPPWGFGDQLAVAVEERVPVLSFGFGIPPPAGLDDAVVLATATTPAEAEALEHAGVDAVVLQGAEAGGHRGTFLSSFEDGLVPLAELIPAAAERCSRPLVAAGGIVDGAGIARALRAGAAGVQLGTAFLFADESGAGRAWKDALRRHETFVTDAYTGRPARGAQTPFLEELAGGVRPAPYPLQAALLGPFRAHEGYGWYLGGTGSARARELPAGELVRVLVEETRHALGRAAPA